MSAKNQHDYPKIKDKIITILQSGAPANWSEMARQTGVDRATLVSAARREWGVKEPIELLGQALASEAPTKLGVTLNEQPNVLEIDFVSKIICTLDDALKASKTDLSVWQVRDHVINFWPLGMKLKSEDGTEHPFEMQLCQVKVWLVRRVLKPIMPVIQPVEIHLKPSKAAPAKRHAVKRSLIVADPQVGFRRRIHSQDLTPFHDRRVLDLAVQISLSEPFDTLELIGDCFDLSEWSNKFTPEPEFYWTTQPAIIEWAWWLAQFSHIKTKRQYEGNHEKRMADLLSVYVKAAYGLRAVDELELPPALSIPRLMAFHKFNVDYITGYPDNFHWINRNVLIRHGDVVRAGPGDSAKAIVNKTTYTTIFGHIHRRELVSRRIKTREGDLFQTAFCPGCACHIDGRVPGSKSDDQWQQGLAVIEYTEDRENIIPIAIEDGRAIYKGQQFTARPRDPEIDKMLHEKLGNTV